ncbi:MAG: cytidine deaminase [Flavobacteriales bacterium]|nr:cytidine deaminase [Flavobacteriales bacterium]
MTSEIIIKYHEITDFGLLSDSERILMDKAIKISKSAYAPYSQFYVGVAMILENNEIIIGNNQENASFPCGVCAERVALSTANTNYPNIKIKTVAITATSKNFNLLEPVGPCGLCRQVLIESESRQNYNIELLLFNDNKVVKFASAKDLLPFYFNETKLKRT